MKHRKIRLHKENIHHNNLKPGLVKIWELLKKKRVKFFIFSVLLVGGLNSYNFTPADMKAIRSIGDEYVIRKVKMIAREYDMDPVLVNSIIVSESSGYKFAVSYVNAKGLMQLMPFVAIDIAKKVDPKLYKALKKNPGLVYDPEVNLRLGMIHLKTYYDLVKDRLDTTEWAPVLHMYNVGPTAYLKRGKRNTHYVNSILQRMKKWNVRVSQK